MSARILIISGPRVGTELSIEDEAARFGDDPACELPLVGVGLEAHVFTLRYVDGKYLVFNRGTHPLRIGGVMLPRGGNAPWRAGDAVELPGETTLQLELDGSGAPAPQSKPVARPQQVVVPMAAPEATSIAVPAEAAKPAASKAGQLALVVLLFAAAIYILLFLDPAAGPTATPTRSFAEIVADLRASPDIAPDLWIAFNEAYALEHRRRDVEAQAAYRRLRDRFEAAKLADAAQGKPLPPVLLEADAYVKRRLSGSF